MPEHSKTGMVALQKLFIDKHGFSKELLRTLVVKYPVILSKEADHIQSVFDLLEKECGLTPAQSMKLIFDCPKLLSVKLDQRMEKILFFFELYHGFTTAQVVNEIFMHFPYLFCCDPVKISQFLAHFRKYKLSQAQIINLCGNNHGLLATKVTNFTGFMDYMKREHDLPAKTVIKVLDDFPEMALQNRRHIIRKKSDLIRGNSKFKNSTYLRNLWCRHPDLFLTSYACMEAKVNYIKRNLNR